MLWAKHATRAIMRVGQYKALCRDDRATLDDTREAVDMLEDLERIARRVFGGTHPFTGRIELPLREARSVLAARETPRA